MKKITNALPAFISGFLGIFGSGGGVWVGLDGEIKFFGSWGDILVVPIGILGVPMGSV